MEGHMAGLARFFVTERHQRPLVMAIWTLVLAICLAIACWMLALNLRETLRNQTAIALDQYIALRTDVIDTFDRLERDVTAPPCTDIYLDQLRRIAFLPDGINEFLHFEDGTLVCSVNAGMFETPYALGSVDIESDNAFGIAFWLDRDMTPIGLSGLSGSFARRGAHVMVIPNEPLAIRPASWMDHEVVVQAPQGRWWHRSGAPGLYAAYLDGQGTGLTPYNGGLIGAQCDPVGVHCVASRVDLMAYVGESSLNAIVIVAAAAIFAAFATQLIHRRIRAFWSFETRFKRHLSDGIRCAYQPIVSTRNGSITGCEVLVRWCDVDGTMIYPDAFLRLVERENLTLQLTEAVISRALSDLTGRIQARPFQVNFNIFPRDFEAEKLEKLFDKDRVWGPFTFAVELVETETLSLDRAHLAVAYLKSRGILTYIDDFGVGYSNMQNLGLIDIDGVKIDRSFAMAPDNSLMARILSHAIEMAHESRRAIVIEGVETRERFETLRANPLVDYAQGYFISRPLDIDGLVAFVQSWTPPRPMAVGADEAVPPRRSAF